MSRFMIITLLAVIATTAAKPYVVAYPSRFYGGYLGPAYDYPVFSYPYTPVTYVETVPVTNVVGGPPPVAAVPFGARLIAKNGGPPPNAPSGRFELPAAPPKAPSARQELPAPPPPQPPPPPPPPAPAPAAPAPPKGPVKVIITKELLGLPDLDPSKLLEALPIQQLLDLPPVKQIVALKTSKLQTIMGLKNTLQGVLQEKLAPIAALLP